MKQEKNRLIFHVDVNSAYLSWEAARRAAAGEADLRNIPSAIGGDRDKRTGVILAKSIPAKAFQIKTGEPVAAALRKCPELVLVPPDFRLYHQCSQAFLAVCRRYAPVVEQFSIDECFLDMSGTELLYPDPEAVAHIIKNKIRDTLGFTVNIGISANKLLAKMASDFEKPDRVHTLFFEELPEKLWPLPVRALFSVGRVTARRLEQAGISTIGALAQANEAEVQRLVGEKLGRQIHNYANGIDNAPVSEASERVKEYSVSTTLEEDLVSAEQARPVLLALADRVSARMRADGGKAFCVAVTIRTHTFHTRSRQKTLAEPTDITAEIDTLAQELFDALWDGQTPLRLLGVALSQIAWETYEQATLFFDQRRDRARKLDQTVDEIRRRYGVGAVVRGGAMDPSSRMGRTHPAQLEERRNGKKER